MCTKFCELCLTVVQNMIMFIPLLIVEWAATVWYHVRVLDLPNRPPSLFPYPIFGNIWNFAHGGIPLTKLCNVKERYGAIVSIYFGHYPAVLVSSHNSIKVLLAQAECSGKPDFLGYTEGRLNNGRRTGIFSTEGSDFIQQRRFLSLSLEGLGVGGTDVGAIIKSEVDELIQSMKTQRHYSIESKDLFNAHITNSLWTIVSGHRLSLDDPELRVLTDFVSKFPQKYGKASSFFFFPWMATYFPNLTGMTDYQNDFGDIKNFMQRKVDEYSEEIKKNPALLDDDNISSLLKSYFVKFTIQDPDTPALHGDLGKSNLVTTLTDMFILGPETVSAALTWAILYLMLHEDVQEEMCAEINNVLEGASPQLPDLNRMPFTMAVISEVLRCSAVVPLAPAHRLTADVDVENYSLQENTVVIPNLYAAHRDRSYWGRDADDFNPYRFLKTSPDPLDGSPIRSYLKRDAYIPFSYGSRACVGKSLAQDQIFYTLVMLVQAIRFMPDSGQVRNDLHTCLESEENIFVRSPKPFKFRINIRQ